MNLLNVLQGSEQWHEVRGKCFTASEAPAMMGASKYMTRDQLLHQKATGERPEISPGQQALFDRGHAAEASIRPVIEEIVGEELYPVTGTDGGKLLASFDGIDMEETVVFEHKLWSEGLAAQVRANDLEPHYYWQLEQQLLVSGAEKAIFVTSDGTRDQMEFMYYHPVEGRAQQLLRGWEQFEKDLQNYTPEVIPEKPEADPIEAFPALSVALVGEVKSSNLPAFKSKAIAFIESINTDLQTDEDFANAEEAVKFCANAEKEIEMVKSQALAQTSTIDELFRDLDQIREKLRQKRLTLDKLVKQQKEQRKNEIINNGRQKLMDDIAKANEEFAPITVTGVTADLHGAAKNKRTIASLISSVNDELTRARLVLAERRDHVRASIAIVKAAGDDFRFLFNDLQQLVDKDHEHLKLIVKQRVDEHKAEQQRKIEEEAQRRAEEIAANERAEAARKEQERLDNERKQAAAEQAPAAEVKQEDPAPYSTGASAEPAKPRVVASSGAPIPSRPSDDKIIEVLALHYRVHESKVIEWLCAMDLNSASARMAANL